MPVNSEAMSPEPNWRSRRRTTARLRASQRVPEMCTIEEKSRVVSVTLRRRARDRAERRVAVGR